MSEFKDWLEILFKDEDVKKFVASSPSPSQFRARADFVITLVQLTWAQAVNVASDASKEAREQAEKLSPDGLPREAVDLELHIRGRILSMAIEEQVK